jgi:hypothetical protein
VEDWAGSAPEEEARGSAVEKEEETAVLGMSLMSSKAQT